MKQGDKNSLPNGWEMKTLGEVAKVMYGYTEKSYIEEIGPKFLRITDIQNDGVNWDTVPYCYINDSDFEKYKLINGDIVFARTGATTGKSYLVINPPKSVFASYLIKLNIINIDLLPEFLFLYFQTKAYWDTINAGISGSAQGGFNATKLSELQIPFPPKEEQQRIVAKLDEAFEAIEKTKANAEQNLKNTKELFDSYLHSIFENKGKDWEEKTLGEISKEFGRGKSKHRPRNWDKLYGGDYPFIQTGDIRNCNHVITEYTQTYSDIGLAQSKLWPAGTICITIAANIAETGVLTFDACFPDSVIGLVVNDKFADRDYVEYLLQSFKSRLQALGKGSAQDNINLKTFENRLFPFPKVSEQQSIVQKLDALSSETKKLEAIYQKKLEDLEELKKSILQKAFSGQL
ncbi:MAG TPA: restriction endonuclease subunit S [Macellibacteroides fermentans]|uniref:restriction endonuclease subunit S n=1 Tax=Macellibacteroides fermentans TaxID=879969 RepID=UPI002CB2E82B|nr:restriction endonuclease subunit S [Macellibacteroides fermentans]